MTSQTLNLVHLEDFLKCPKFAQLNWSNSNIDKKHILYKPMREIILEAYRDLANLEKEIEWKTIRNRTHTVLTPLLLKENDVSIEEYFKLAKQTLEQLRTWYLSSFRDGPTTCLINLEVESIIPGTGINIAATLDAILISPVHTILVEVTDKFKNKKEIKNSIYLKAKAWLLHKQGIDISSILLITIHNGVLSTLNIPFTNEDFFKIEKVLAFAAGGIKHQVFYPSVTDMCNTCIFKEVCKW